MKKLLLALLFVGAAPGPLLACMCEYVTFDSQPPRIRPWQSYPHIFIGNAIEVDPPHLGARVNRVKFVTEASWTGAMADTVTMRVGDDAPCAHFVAGARYFVIADTAGGRLVLPKCEEGWTLAQPVAHRRRQELGDPTWTAPPMGRRAIDSGVVRLGDPIGRALRADSMPLPIPRTGFITRFEVGDYPGSHFRRGMIWIAPGLYQYRVWFEDGTSYSSYLSARCESTIGEERNCYMFRYYGALRETRERSPSPPSEAMPGDAVCDSAVVRAHSAHGDTLHAAIVALERCARGPATLAFLWYRPRPDTVALRVLSEVSARVRDVRVLNQLKKTASDMWQPAHVRLAAISALVQVHVPCHTVAFREMPTAAGIRLRPQLNRMTECTPVRDDAPVRFETPRETLVTFLRRIPAEGDPMLRGVFADLADMLDAMEPR